MWRVKDCNQKTTSQYRNNVKQVIMEKCNYSILNPQDTQQSPTGRRGPVGLQRRVTGCYHVHNVQLGSADKGEDLNLMSRGGEEDY